LPFFTLIQAVSILADGAVLVSVSVLSLPAIRPIVLGRFTVASTFTCSPGWSATVGTMRSPFSSTGMSSPLFTAVAWTSETSPPKVSVLILPSEEPSASMLEPESAKAETTKAATAATTSVTMPPTNRRFGQRRGASGG
jgi:hypothetical protein